MLPSSSSPVESAVAPVVLPLAHQGLAGAGVGGECHQPPRRGGDPPDLCAGEGRSGWMEEVDSPDCVSGGCCKGESQEEDSGQQMEESAPEDAQDGAWGPGGGIDVGVGGAVACLPDLCDTSGGHTRPQLTHDLSNDLQEESYQCHSSPRQSCSRYDNSPQLSFISQRSCEDEENTNNTRASSVRQGSIDEIGGESDTVMCEEEEGQACGGGDSDSRTEVSECSVRSKDWPKVDQCGPCEPVDDFGQEEEHCGPIEEYLVHDSQRISLVACGVTQCEVDMADLTGHDECGLSLITHNLHHSSHPMFDKWPCYFYITQERLPTISIDSHGKHIGSEAPMFFPGAPGGQGVSGLSEEEQVKMAKRMGLIMHLPCGTFDETKKSGECVICMIDFSVGDKVRYLPCMHTYHTECIDDWLMRSFTCPSCLEPVDAALLNTYGSS